MARFNEILAGRYNRFLQKFLSMKGGPPAPQLASEISATWALFHGRENRYLEDWKTFGAELFLGGVAAQDTVFRLNNPAGSNTIAVVESLKVRPGTALGEIVFEFANTANGDLANLTTPAAFDNRSNPPGNGTNGAACRWSGANNIAQLNHFVFDDYVGATANQTSPDIIVHEDQEIQLLPNSDLQLRGLTLNVAWNASVRWRERPLEESERF